MTRTVFAVDVTATMLSLSLLTETSDGSPAVPIKKLLPVPPAGDLAHTPRKTWDRALRAVDAAAETILPGGIPTLVMMARQQWADLGRDQSAGRRLEIHALLADRLHAAAVPVAEFPYPTVLQWLHDGQTSRRVGTTRARPSVMDDIAREVERVWGVKQPTYVSKDTEREISYPFRRQVIALAAVGGMAVGIPTAIDVTAKRLELLHHVDESVPAAVMADGGRLRQVLANLIGNAVKFTHKGSIKVNVRSEPVRVEAGAMAMTRGDVTVRGVDPDHLALVLNKLADAGAKVDRYDDGFRVRQEARPVAINVSTLPYPGFPTDLQPMMIALAAVADGMSVVTENVFEARFRFVEEMIRLGADARTDGHHAVIRGIPQLSSAPVWSSDIRAGAGLVLAALVADGDTEVHDVFHIDRGYPLFVENLVTLGAEVERVSS